MPNSSNRLKITTMADWKLFLEKKRSEEGWNEICDAILFDCNLFNISDFKNHLDKPEEVINDDTKIFEVYLSTIGTWFNYEGKPYTDVTKYIKSSFFKSLVDANTNELRMSEIEKCFELFVQNTRLLQTRKSAHCSDSYITYFRVFEINNEKIEKVWYKNLFKIAQKEQAFFKEKEPKLSANRLDEQKENNYQSKDETIQKLVSQLNETNNAIENLKLKKVKIENELMQLVNPENGENVKDSSLIEKSEEEIDSVKVEPTNLSSWVASENSSSGVESENLSSEFEEEEFDLNQCSTQ